MPQMTINLMKHAEYPSLKRGHLEVGNSLGHDLSVKYGRTTVKKMPKLVKGLGPCVGLALFGITQKFVAHSAPELDKPSLVKNFISKKIDELKMSDKQRREINAVIYGGIAYDNNNPISEDSCRLVDAMEEGCRLEGVEPTIITGQFGNGLDTRLDSYVGQNQITIWGKLIDKIKLTQKATPAEIQKILEELFEYIKIPKNTDLKILEGVPDKITKLIK